MCAKYACINDGATLDDRNVRGRVVSPSKAVSLDSEQRSFVVILWKAVDNVAWCVEITSFVEFSCDK